VSFVVDDPFDSLAFGELHGLGHGRGKVDVILFAGLALDELNFGWKSHELETGQITRYKSSEIKLSEILNVPIPDCDLARSQTPERGLQPLSQAQPFSRFFAEGYKAPSPDNELRGSSHP